MNLWNFSWWRSVGLSWLCVAWTMCSIPITTLLVELVSNGSRGPTITPLQPVLLQPTWTDHAVGGDTQQASLFCALKEIGKSTPLAGRCGNALHLLACHLLPDRRQIEGHADGHLPEQQHPHGKLLFWQFKTFQ